jgi:small subunit ribosomal protein S20
MANHVSAEKRHRQNIKRRTRNRNTKARIRTLEKKVRSLIGSKAGSLEVAEAAKLAESALAKAATKGILHPRNAARHASRLAKAAFKSTQ